MLHAEDFYAGGNNPPQSVTIAVAQATILHSWLGKQQHDAVSLGWGLIKCCFYVAIEPKP